MLVFNYRYLITSTVILALLLSSCSRKNSSLAEEEVIHLYMNKFDEWWIKRSGEKETARFKVEMTYGGKLYSIKDFNSRGKGTLSFDRKSYSVDVKGDLTASTGSNSETREYGRFKLLAMPFDYTYIENKLSHYIMEELGIWHLNTFFTELKLNKSHQGLYLFHEDPYEYTFKEAGALCTIRRNMKGGIDKYKINKKNNAKADDFYLGKYHEIYDIITEYSEEELLNSLESRMNLENYMRKMVVDLILRNGDSTDEVFFYAIENGRGEIYFEIHPWDYDDIFSKKAHEIGREGDNGEKFGIRNYETEEDHEQELGGRLVYSIEDDLDYIILKDDILYRKYLEILMDALQILNPEFISSTFSHLHDELLPFYNIPEVIENSKKDVKATSMEIWKSNMKEKEEYLHEVISDLLEQTRVQYQEMVL